MDLNFITDFCVMADGGCRGNHDKSIPNDAYGSWAIATKLFNKGISKYPNIPFGNHTNNEAEYMAQISGVHALIGVIEIAGWKPEAFSVTIRSDSRNLIGQCSGQFTGKVAENIQPLKAELLSLTSRFKEVVWEKVPRGDMVAEFNH